MGSEFHSWKIQSKRRELFFLQQRILVLEHKLSECKLNGSSNSFFQPAYQQQRRALSSHIEDLQNFLFAQIAVLQSNRPNEFGHVMLGVSELFKHILSIDRNLSEVDGMARARENEAIRIKRLIDLNFMHSQCANQTIQSDFVDGCGFGCQMHHMLSRILAAFITQKKFLADFSNFIHGVSSFKSLFEPLLEGSADGCYINSSSLFSKGNATNPMVSSERRNLPIPAQLVEKSNILPLHGNPIALFVGHLGRMLLNPTSSMKNDIQAMKKQLNFSSPIVGVHIRRGDKIGTEAEFHSIDEYMVHVSEYFDIEEIRLQRKVTRKVFLASDESSVFDDLPERYPQYKFLSTRLAGLRDAEPSDEIRTKKIAADVLMMAETDFLVCTFSSNVCRLSYELMQTRYDDGSWRFRTLDHIYHSDVTSPHDYLAVEDNFDGQDQLAFKKGDLIEMHINLKNGFCLATNRRTNQQGVFPCYKAIDYVVISH